MRSVTLFCTLIIAAAIRSLGESPKQVDDDMVRGMLWILLVFFMVDMIELGFKITKK